MLLGGYMLSAIIVFISSILFIGCGTEPPMVITEVQTVEVPHDLTDEEEVLSIVAEENAFRELSGNPPLVPGLVCTLHALTGTPSNIPNTLPAPVVTYVYLGSFNVPDSPGSPGLPILPAALRPLYTQWYVIRCQGRLVVTISDYYQFSLSSDDGSKLFLNNSLVVNNDGNHPIQTVSNTILLRRGIHTFRLDYMQATSNHALILSDHNGVIPSYRFYR